MLKNFNNLDNEYKDRFLKMCLLLFPQYRSARIRKDGTVVFMSKLSLFKRVRIPFFNLISEDIATKLSVLQWNNKQLTKKYYETIADIRTKYNTTEQDNILFIKEVIDFLYSKFLITGLKDIYNSYYDVTTTSGGYKLERENNSDSVFVTTIKGQTSITKKHFTLDKLVKELKNKTLVTLIVLGLNLATSMAILSNLSTRLLPILSYQELLGQSPWKIIYH